MLFGNTLYQCSPIQKLYQKYMTESSTGASGITVKTSIPKIIIEIGVTVPLLLARDHGNAPQ